MKHTKLRSIINGKVITINAQATLSEALDAMAAKSISSLVIVDDTIRPIGIFTEHDALRCIASKRKSATPLSKIMSQEVLSLPVDEEIHDAYAAMSARGFRHLVVVDDAGVLAGVISEGDFLRHIGLEQFVKVQASSEVMNRSLVWIKGSSTLEEAAVRMNEQGVDYAIVIEKDMPKGLINERDITLWMAKNGDAKTLVKELCHTDYPVIHEATLLQEAASMMEQHGVHQLIVVDGEDALVGLLGRDEVLQAIHGKYFEFLIKLVDEKSATISEMAAGKKQLKTEHELIEKSEAKFRTLFNLLPYGVLMVDMISGLPSEFNSVAHNQIGYTAQEFAQMHIADYEAIESMDEHLEHLQKIKELGSDLFETKFRCKNGLLIDVEVNVVCLTILDHPYLMAVCRDISERKRHEQQLEVLANNDVLTGLANRPFLLAHLQNAVDKAFRDNRMTALLLFDLDRFKNVNDSFGHQAGDELLICVAERFRERMREGDLIARLGGDEFAIVLDNLVRVEDAGRIAEEMIAALGLEYDLGGSVSVHVGASAGIVISPNHGNKAAELLQFADAALYRAKGEGRGTYRYYTDELTEAARKRVECETQLRRAIENGEFEVYYQPQVHMATGRIVGAEALVRWNDPVRGIISPVLFIPLAEETGLIGRIGEWVLNETCRQGKIWLDEGHRLTLAVNVSAHQMRHQDVPKMVDRALKKSGYSAERLELELTESALMDREEESVEVLHILRARGVRLAIDDFGTGYSSLSYLKRFPIDVLKIDKSFVDDIPFEEDDMAIVTAIIAMGKALGFQILAEGTERQEQIDFLMERGCTMYQGYFKSPPVPAHEFEKLLS